MVSKALTGRYGFRMAVVDRWLLFRGGCCSEVAVNTGLTVLLIVFLVFTLFFLSYLVKVNKSYFCFNEKMSHHTKGGWGQGVGEMSPNITQEEGGESL